jgi:hypothetical protein
MLSHDELSKLKINEIMAREAFIQVERHLGDILDTKKVVEQKATTLFSVFVTISLAAFGAGAAMLNNPALACKAWPLFVGGLFFVAGAGAFLSALFGSKYGTMGSKPSDWLKRGVIDREGPEIGLERAPSKLNRGDFPNRPHSDS